MSPKVLVAGLIASLFATACAGAAPPPMVADAPRAAPPAGAPVAAAQEAAPPPAKKADAPTSSAKAKNAAKTPSLTVAPATAIIFTGDMKMMADEDAVSKTIDRIIDIAEGVGGHVASRKDSAVQIKVPSTQFRETMKAIDSLGGVTSQSIGAEDVSEELHDLDVRLANLRATRSRLQELMNKAGAIPDVLTVEKELERVAQEIDKIEGRLEFLKSHAALSVINVALTAKPKPVAPVVAVSTPPPPSKPKVLELPVPWVSNVGIDPLLSLKK